MGKGVLKYDNFWALKTEKEKVLQGLKFIY